MRPAAACLAGLALLAAPPVLSEPKLGGVVLSEQKGGPARSVFKPDTPKVYLRAAVSGATASNAAHVDWYAVKTAVAPPNYKMDSFKLSLDKNANEVTFSMSKPTAGWPEGEYRVDLFLDQKNVAKVPFRIAK